MLICEDFKRKLLMTSARKCPTGLKEKSYETFQSVKAVSGMKIEQGAPEMQHCGVTWKL
jgi:hypothetical protein